MGEKVFVSVPSEAAKMRMRVDPSEGGAMLPERRLRGKPRRKRL
jgi:hypothetical protein